MAYSVQMIVDSIIDNTETGNEAEYLQLEIALAAAAADVTVALGTMTDPKFVAILGAEGVSFKVTGGTDSIGADPMALIMNTDGLSIASVLLSNSAAQEQTVTIVAAE